MYVIGFGNKARHGKDYCAKYLQSLMPLRSRVFSWADDLKAWCRVTGLMKEKNGKVLQLIGTDIFREQVDRNFWVNMLKLKLKEVAASDPDLEFAIISDCRFPNEAEFCQNHGMIIRVERYNPDGSMYIDPKRDAKHISETALDEWTFDHYMAAKSGNIAGLRKQVGDFHEQLPNYIERAKRDNPNLVGI